jgi:hypothetical protein
MKPPKSNTLTNPYALTRVHGPDGRTFHFPARTPRHKILGFMKKTYASRSVVGSMGRKGATLGRMAKPRSTVPTPPAIPKPPEIP